MPHRYIHTYYYMYYQQVMWDKEHPEEAEPRQMGEALMQELS